MQAHLINRNSRPYVGRLSAAGQMGSQMGLGTCHSDRMFATAINTSVELPRQAVQHEDRLEPGKGVVDTR